MTESNRAPFHLGTISCVLPFSCLNVAYCRWSRVKFSPSVVVDTLRKCQVLEHFGCLDGGHSTLVFNPSSLTQCRGRGRDTIKIGRIDQCDHFLIRVDDQGKVLNLFYFFTFRVSVAISAPCSLLSETLEGLPVCMFCFFSLTEGGITCTFEHHIVGL